MSWIIEDQDEWEDFGETRVYGTYPGTNISFGSCTMGRRRRAPEEVARIRAERLRAEEDAILLRAQQIIAARALVPEQAAQDQAA